MSPAERVAAALHAEMRAVDDDPSWHLPLLLADFECEHGHLPHDPKISCDCWRRDG